MEPLITDPAGNAFNAVSFSEPAAAPAYLNADTRGGTAPNGKPSLTIDAAALNLTRESSGWDGVRANARNGRFVGGKLDERRRTENQKACR